MTNLQRLISFGDEIIKIRNRCFFRILLKKSEELK